MQQVVGTWTHKFNDKIYTATEALVHVREYDAIDHPTAEVPFQSGSFPVQNGYAPEWAVRELHDVPDCPERVFHSAE